MKWFFACSLFFVGLIVAPPADGRPCVWPRCKKQAVRDAPQLCAEHLRLPAKREGGELRALIYANDVEGIRRLAPIAGPDYLIQGEPPLAWAVYAGKVEAAQALIEAGADVKWRTATGQNLVYLAGLYKKIPIAAFLVSEGAGTKEDAISGLREAQKIASINRLAGMFLRGQIEEDTGIKLDESFDDNWDQMARDLLNKHVVERKPSPAKPEAEKDHGDEIAIRATVIGIPDGDRLVVREGPGMDYPKTGALKNGEDITITGPVVMNEETDWYPIRSKDTKGWARGKFLRREVTRPDKEP
jgi:hypothetical protein